MLKLFRTIRKNLLMKNQSSKYFKYAVGEIILVVIGILIALQINNWNTQKNTSNTELEILDLMQKNLNADLEDMKGNLDFYKIRQRATIIVLKKLNDPAFENDSLPYSYANLGLHPYFIEITSAYENLKSIGFEIIKNDRLKENIMHIYSNRYQWIENLENDHSNFYKTKLESLLIENFIHESLTDNAKPINIKELQNNHVFKETLKYSLGWLTYIIERYKVMIIDVGLLKEQITTELEERK
jgi:hypothetical protein